VARSKVKRHVLRRTPAPDSPRVAAAVAANGLSDGTAYGARRSGSPEELTEQRSDALSVPVGSPPLPPSPDRCRVTIGPNGKLAAVVVVNGWSTGATPTRSGSRRRGRPRPERRDPGVAVHDPIVDHESAFVAYADRRPGPAALARPVETRPRRSRNVGPPLRS